ncbi:MAG: hypothetical protein KDK27_12945, partial [Leptospiraceae bacterium]|nr:hypothetical protein [Leptospiraceae bacterium]
YLLEALDPELAPDFRFYEPISEVRAVWRSAGRHAALRQSECLVETMEELVGAIQSTGRSAQIHIHPTYARLFPDLSDRIRSLLPDPDVDAVTGRYFLRRWTRNTAHRIFRSTGFSHKLSTRLTDAREEQSDRSDLRFIVPAPKNPQRGRPGIVVYAGAGPQLEQGLNSIFTRFSRDAVFLIAADTALPFLMAQRYRPDLVLSIDAGRGTLFHLSAVFQHGTRWSAAREYVNSDTLPPVLTWMAGLPHLDLIFDEVLYYVSSFPADQILSQGPLRSCAHWQNPTGNLIGLALNVAANLGSAVLLTAGADFRSNSAGQTHIRGSGYTWYARLNHHRTRPLSGYVPGGYQSGLTARNQHSLRGLESLARQLNVRLATARDLENTSDVERMLQPMSWQLACTNVRRSQLARFLESRVDLSGRITGPEGIILRSTLAKFNKSHSPKT